MNISMKTAGFFCFFAFVSLSASPSRALERVSCVMHIHSSFSGNGEQLPLEEIIQRARERKIDVVIPTDHDLMRWEYGLAPLRNIVKKSVERNSVLRLGPETYLAEIRRLRERFPDTIIIPGVESAPFYYWSGNPFNGTLSLHEWNKHMLIIGMERPEDYTCLPLVSNPGAGTFNPVHLWPLLLVFGGVFFGGSRILRSLVILCGAVLFINNYPFSDYPFTQYAGQRGERPYQGLIDYARSKGALTFWAHPEAPNWAKPVKTGPITVETQPYMESLRGTERSTGFSIFSEGYRPVGSPGGIWDRTLLDYCEGKRQEPLWAAGELDYGLASFEISMIQNILWVKDRTPQSVLESLKNGAFFAVWRDKEWGMNIEEFFVSSGGGKAICGQTLRYEKPARIHLSVSASDGKAHLVKASIIRDGRVLKVLETPAPAGLIYEDTEPLAAGKHYYRVAVEERYPHMAALNPVFIVKEGERKLSF